MASEPGGVDGSGRSSGFRPSVASTRVNPPLLYKQCEVFQINVIKIKIPVEKPIPEIEE